jgi:hypothetical protein
MTIQVIPPPSQPYVSQTTTIEGVPYLLYWDYNTRENAWYLSIADASGVDIYNGMKLICTVPSVGPNFLLAKCKDPRRPPGDFVVISQTNDYDPPGIGDLVPGVGRCALMYITSDVFAQLVTAGGAAAYAASLNAGTTTGTGSTYGSQ